MLPKILALAILIGVALYILAYVLTKQQRAVLGFHLARMAWPLTIAIVLIVAFISLAQGPSMRLL